MNFEKRSPWVVLGIAFPSNKPEAKRAFASRSRQLARGADMVWTQEDLGWADAAITLAHDEPTASVAYYRIPANPDLFRGADEGDLFVPEPQPIARTTGSVDFEALDARCAQAATDELRGWLENLTLNPEFDLYDDPETDEPDGANA